jgi:hypothetical protein
MDLAIRKGTTRFIFFEKVKRREPETDGFEIEERETLFFYSRYVSSVIAAALFT